MAGNVWEWVNDWYSGTYYSTLPYLNPPGPAEGTSKVLRSGSWDTMAYFLRTAGRGYYAPSSRYNDIGFRCAADF